MSERLELIGLAKERVKSSGDRLISDMVCMLECDEKLIAQHLEALKEATIAWSVCASIHRTYAKDKDGVFTIRQNDFVRYENEARKKLIAASQEKPE